MMPSFKSLVFLFLLVGSSISMERTAFAQTDACPTIVQTALDMTAAACAGLGRNQICYGNTDVLATDWEQTALADFESPGDMTSIDSLASLATMPLNVEADTWGIAVLAVQADLPNTLPGQNVTFVLYGDVTLESEVPPVDHALPAPRCNAVSTGGINLRSGPGTDYVVAAGMATGDQLTVTGRNAAGDWLQLNLKGHPAWVYTPLVTVDCDIDTLTVVEVGATAPGGYLAPMQAFRFMTGVGQPQCAEAPTDGLLIQAPVDTLVHFRINGIDMQIGSTALLHLGDDGSLQSSTLDGTISVTSAGQTQTAEPGYQITAQANEPPNESQPYDYETVRSAPVTLLPEAVNIPITVPATFFDWVDTGIQLQTGQVITVRASGTVNVWTVCETEKYEKGMADANCADYSVGPIGGIVSNPNIMPSDVPGNPYPVQNAPIHSLAARVGDGEGFFVGAGGTFVADRDGLLQFRVNDAPSPDNEGAFIVIVEVGE